MTTQTALERLLAAADQAELDLLTREIAPINQTRILALLLLRESKRGVLQTLAEPLKWAPPADKTPDVLRSLSPEEFAKLEPITEVEIREALAQGQREIELVQQHGRGMSSPSDDVAPETYFDGDTRAGVNGARIRSFWGRVSENCRIAGCRAPFAEHTGEHHDCPFQVPASAVADLRIFHLTTELSALSKEAQEHAAARAALVEERDTLKARLQELTEAAREGLKWIDRDYPANDYEAARASAKLEAVLAAGAES